MQAPLGVLIIGRKRPGFDQEWNASVLQQASDALRELGFACVGNAKPVVDDQTIAAALAEIRSAGAEGLLVLQPSLGNGQLAMTVAQQWPDPVVLWATPERADNPKVSSCSLVAQHLWASIFRQTHHPFELICGDPQDTPTRAALRDAIVIARAAAKIRRAKVGLIGSHAPGFIAMQADTFAMKNLLGVQLQSLSLPQFIERSRGIAENDVSRDVEVVQGMKLPMNGVTVDDLAINSRYYIAMKQIITEEQLDALALQCWPELPNIMGQWPYLALVRLADEGIAIAMEGDVDGALTCLAAQHLGAGVGFITDWLEHDERTIHFWHPGVAPMRLCDSPSLSKHFNIERPMVVDGRLHVDKPMTVARFWRCDDRYFATAFQGRSIPPRRKVTGNQAVLEVEGGNVPRLFDALVHAGLPHHPVLFEGHHERHFRRLARMLEIQWVEKENTC